MFSKNLIMFLVAVIFLVMGLGAGYYFGGHADTKMAVVGGDGVSKIGNEVVREKIKTELTSQGAYGIAFSEAGQWAADAYLSSIELSSEKIDINGLSNGWKFIFYSKIKNSLYEILIKDGESRGGKEKTIESGKIPQTLKSEMVDSAALAKSFFGLYPADTEIISLKMYYDAGAKKFLWTIFYPKGSYTINAEK